MREKELVIFFQLGSTGTAVLKNNSGFPKECQESVAIESSRDAVS